MVQPLVSFWLTVSKHTIQKKMADVHLTKIPCEPNTTNRLSWPYFSKIRPCTNNIVYDRFQVCRTFLCVFMGFVRVFVRYELRVINVSAHFTCVNPRPKRDAIRLHIVI